MAERKVGFDEAEHRVHVVLYLDYDGAKENHICAFVLTPSCQLQTRIGTRSRTSNAAFCQAPTASKIDFTIHIGNYNNNLVFQEAEAAFG